MYARLSGLKRCTTFEGAVLKPSTRPDYY